MSQHWLSLKGIKPQTVDSVTYRVSVPSSALNFVANVNNKIAKVYALSLWTVEFRKCHTLHLTESHMYSKCINENLSGRVRNLSQSSREAS